MLTKSNFDNFESALYLESVSLPLNYTTQFAVRFIMDVTDTLLAKSVPICKYEVLSDEHNLMLYM